MGVIVFERGNLFLSFFFVLVAIPCLFLNAFLLAPFQGADEINHFARAEQVASGCIVGQRIDQKIAGGYVSKSLLNASKVVEHIPFHVENKLTSDIILELRQLKIQSEQVFYGFGNTVINAPIFYLPSSLGIGFSKFIDTSILNTLLISRILNGLICIALSSMALYVVRFGKHIMFSILTLPMSLGLFGVVSPDGLIFACTALVVALITRIEDYKSSSEKGCLLALLVILLSSVVATKIAYLPLIFLFFVPSVYHHIGLRGALICTSATLFVEFLWFVFGILPVSVPLFHDGYVISAKDQLYHIISNPLSNFSLIFNTLLTLGGFYIQSFIGILGCLDAYLKPQAYVYYEIYLALSILFDFLFEKKGEPRRGDALFVILIFLATFFCIEYALYLAWSPVGGSIIEGVQGRYFIPMMLLLTLIVPNLQLRKEITPVWSKLLYILSLPVIFVLPYALFSRYFG